MTDWPSEPVIAESPLYPAVAHTQQPAKAGTDDWIEKMRTDYEAKIAALTAEGDRWKEQCRLERQNWLALEAERNTLQDKLGLLIAAIGPYSTTDIAIKAIERDRAESVYLRQLESCVIQRHALEPKHSREDHECEECAVLAELKLMRRH